ncbi:MAG: porin [Bacteroidetes bacterium]|nr:porin [Bacteroidota bacterium]
MRYFSFAFFFFFLLYFHVAAQDIGYTTFGEGVRIMASDSSFALKFSARFQTRYVGVVNLEDNSYQDRILIRRWRLKFDGFAVDPRLVYKLELGFSNRDTGGGDIIQTNNTSRVILDAVLKWNFYKNWTVWFGQTKLPGNRERVISSQKLQFVDRSLANTLTLDRDIGVQLRHHHTLGKVVVREIGSISMGEGRDITVDNAGGYDYTARLEILPFGTFISKGDYFSADLKREPSPKLAIGLTYDYNDDASKSRGQLGSFLSEARDLLSIHADAIFKYKGVSSLVEYTHREVVTRGPVISTDTLGNVTEAFLTGNGFQISGGYLLKSNYEIALRWHGFLPEEEIQRNDIYSYALGLSKYIRDHNLKVQSDFTYSQIENTDDAFVIRFQVELSF